MTLALALLACFPRVDMPVDATDSSSPSDTGADTADTGRDTGADTSSDTSTDTSTDTGADSGNDTGADTGDTSTGPACLPDLEIGARVGDAVATGTCVDDDVDATCGARRAPDAVVRWTAPSAGPWTIDTVGSTATDTVVYVLDSSCEAEVACNDDFFEGWSSVDVDVDPGDTLLIGVEGGAWQLNVWQGACADANIGEGLSVEGNSEGADTDFTALCQPNYGVDVVLRWVAPSTGVWRFSTEGSNYDTVLALRSGGCEGAEIACGDDTEVGSTDFTYSTVTASVREGDVVFIGIGGYASDAGDWVLDIARE